MHAGARSISLFLGFHCGVGGSMETGSDSDERGSRYRRDRRRMYRT